VITLFCLATGLLMPSEQVEHIGKKIYRNECNNNPKLLVFWKKGEEFPSCGIGHFIWYPKNQSYIFKEQFSHLLNYLQKRAVTIPSWIDASFSCPWVQQEYEAGAYQSQINELRTLLESTISLQAHFIIDNFKRDIALLKLAENLKKRLNALMGDAQGLFAVIDYVHFKGMGTNVTERYHGQGWGLVQVLENMHHELSHSLLEQFVESAKKVLAQRVKNAPPERKEEQWLPGWCNRVNRYLEKN
jgi:hypothetical protein